jgi:hypothetical protein
MSSTPCRVLRWLEKLAARDAIMAPMLRVQAGLRRIRHHCPINARWSAAEATALETEAVEVTMLSVLAAMAGTGETQLPQPSHELRVASRLTLMRASRLSMSTCGLTSRRRSLRAPLA